MLTWAHYYQGATTDADWDVMQAIIRILKMFDSPTTIEQVSGHQDDKIDY